MALVRIEERQGVPDGTNAVLSFEHGAQYPITIRDPFSDAEQQEQDLEWYFEEHLAFPFTNQVKARQAAESITAYGEALFLQVFADAQAYADYRESSKAGLHTFQFEIAGSPQFHRYHWEALKDPTLPCPLVLQATMIRNSMALQAGDVQLDQDNRQKKTESIVLLCINYSHCN